MEACSVVIPLFNGGAWIEATLRSVVDQTFAPAAVIVVDDGSTDDSRRRVLQFPGVRLLRSDGKGAVQARNLGLRLVRTPLVAFVDQDDLWHPRHLEVLSRLLERRPEAPAAVAGSIKFDGAAPQWADITSFHWTRLDPWSTYPFVSPVACPAQVVIRRSAMLGLGGWDGRFSGVADLHLWLRLSADGPLPAVEEPTVGRRLHGESNFNRLLLDPVPLLQRRCAALLAAGRARLRRLPRGASRRALARQMRLLGRVTALASGFADGSRGTVQGALGRLAAIEPPGDEMVWHSVFRYLIYWLCFGGDPASLPQRRAALLGALRDAWPAGSPQGRAVLERYLAGPVSP